jgi:hypothetical protein
LSDTFSIVIFDDNGNEVDIKNLKDPVEFMFPMSAEMDIRRTSCAFWEDSKSDWATKDCVAKDIISIGK